MAPDAARNLERLILLSDGVFAIAMTLSAIDIHAPAHWDGRIETFLAEVMPSFAAFFWSFFATSQFWIGHRRLFTTMIGTDPMITGLTLFLLGQITLVPVAVRVLGELGFVLLGFFVYLGLFALIGTTLAAIWIHANWAADLIRPRRGPYAVVIGGVMQVVLPVATTALGTLSALPGRHWLGALVVPVIAAAAALRRWAVAADNRRRARAVEAEETA